MHLGFDRHEALAIATSEIKALDLNVHEEFLEVAAVGDQKRVRDHLAAMAEAAGLEIVRHLLPGLRRAWAVPSSFSRKRFAMLDRDDQKRMVVQITGNARGDVLVRKLGVALSVFSRVAE